MFSVFKEPPSEAPVVSISSWSSACRSSRARLEPCFVQQWQEEPNCQEPCQCQNKTLTTKKNWHGLLWSQVWMAMAQEQGISLPWIPCSNLVTVIWSVYSYKTKEGHRSPPFSNAGGNISDSAKVSSLLWAHTHSEPLGRQRLVVC